MKSIVVKIDYFGKLPPWFPVFLESCAANPTIEWHLHTDDHVPERVPGNVRFTQMKFSEYCEMVSDVLRVNFSPNSPYSIVHLKPILGVIHRDVTAGFDYFACSDIDLIYGDIRRIYDDFILSHNVISSHDGMVSGHFALFKNDEWVRNAYNFIPRWREIIQNPECTEWADVIDEAHMTAIFAPSEQTRAEFSRMCGTSSPHPKYYSNNYFKEQWSTPFKPEPWLNGSHEHPGTWFWKDGVVSNSQDIGREFLYLHFMNFKSKHYVNESIYGNALTWDKLKSPMNFDMIEYYDRPSAERCVRIDRYGLHLV